MEDKIKLIRALVRPVLVIGAMAVYAAGSLESVHMDESVKETFRMLTWIGFVWYFGERTILKALKRI